MNYPELLDLRMIIDHKMFNRTQSVPSLSITANENEFDLKNLYGLECFSVECGWSEVQI